MSAKTKARILWVTIMVTVGAVFLMLIVATIPHPPTLIISIISFVIFILLMFSVSYSVPGRCQKLECNGRIQRTWVKVGHLQWKYQYICVVCEDVYHTIITFDFRGSD